MKETLTRRQPAKAMDSCPAAVLALLLVASGLALGACSSNTSLQATPESLGDEKGLSSQGQDEKGNQVLHTIWVTKPFEKKPNHLCAYQDTVLVSPETGEPERAAEPRPLNLYPVTISELEREGRGRWLFSALATLPVNGLSSFQELIGVGDPEAFQKRVEDFEKNRLAARELVRSLKDGEADQTGDTIELAGDKTILEAFGEDFVNQDPAMKYKVPNFRSTRCPDTPTFEN